MTDEAGELIRQRRYRDALEQLLNLFEHKIFRMAVTMLKDRGRAEEVTQDVFLKVWRALPDYDGRASLSTWIYTIARNTCLSAVRSATYRRTTPIDEVTEPTATSHIHRDLALAECVAALPEVERLVITLFYWEDRSIRDVALALDLPEGTVKSHLHRARRALGEMMEQ
jgi:RNA polymerase sigma-70 factor (ECF subfamily)